LGYATGGPYKKNLAIRTATCIRPSKAYLSGMKTRYLLVSLFTLAACDGGEVKETLGLNRESPDEFVVVSRPPLSVPPEFTLIPPEPGAVREGARSADTARSVLVDSAAQSSEGGQIESEFQSEFGALKTLQSPQSSPNTAVLSVSSGDAGTPGDSFFLNKAGADKADPEIRRKLGAESVAPPPEKEDAKTLYDSLTGKETAEPVVDAKKEAVRLRENKKKGKKLNDGDVPTTENQPKSVIDTLF
jgi:hypothetical protein